ncbi:hypothetical protein SAMN04488689_104310 [Paenibacillus sp. cl6col]|nr:hypothetical protein PAAL66ix_21107 [Paenibacillus alvei A6-6i-x]SDF32266.1 hypothetical protein SAMN04488689_104310 [Paenibacillus sp. cl6col]
MDWISEPLSVTMERGKRKNELEGRITFRSGIIYIRKLEQCGKTNGCRLIIRTFMNITHRNAADLAASLCHISSKTFIMIA